MKIWTIKSDLLEDIVDSYIDYVNNPYSLSRQTSDWWNSEMAQEHPEPEKKALLYDSEGHSIVENLPKPQRDKTRAHFMSLLHQLYLRYISNKEAWFSLNTQILQTQYRYYNYMLICLCKKLILSPKTEYKDGFLLCQYTINTPEIFHPVECNNKIILSDLEKCSKIFKELHKKNIKRAKEHTSSSFINNYNKMIKEFKLIDIAGAEEFVNTHKYDEKKTHSKLYYQYLLNKLKEGKIKEIEKCDENGRIYHIGTQIPKLLKPYTNITYSIDCKNSHPMLFNYLIFEYYLNKDGISINNRFNFKYLNNKLYFFILYYICNYYDNKTTYHYFMQELCNELKNSNIEDDKIETIKKIPKDVIAYLSNSSHGEIWDEIHKANPQYDRNEIKKEMFKELFYSPRKNIRQKAKFAAAFQKKYPTVTKIIRFYKRTFHTQCQEQNLTKVTKKKGKDEEAWEKDEIQLAHKLMQLESCIFTQILKKLFRLSEFKGFAIHDAIVILDNSIASEIVCNIMKTVFQEMGLYPTFDIEYYNA